MSPEFIYGIVVGIFLVGATVLVKFLFGELPPVRGKGVRINCKIEGEPAEIIRDLKKRGLFTSNTDLIIQAVMVLHEKIVERDLKEAQLKEIREKEEGEEW